MNYAEEATLSHPNIHHSKDSLSLALLNFIDITLVVLVLQNDILIYRLTVNSLLTGYSLHFSILAYHDHLT